MPSPPTARQTYMTDRIRVPAATEPALPRLSHLPMPTLLLHGTNAPPAIAEITTHLTKTIPTARAQTLPGAAHMAPLSHATLTTQAIAAFTSR